MENSQARKNFSEFTKKSTITLIDEEIGRLNVQFETVKSDYLNYIKHEQGVSQATFVTYQSWLNRYHRWLIDEGFQNPETSSALSVATLRKYLYTLSGNKLRPRTIRAAFFPLKGVCAFLVNQGFISEDANPTKKLKLPKKDAAARLLVEDSEVALLFEAAEKQLDSRKVAQSRALLATLCYTGLRASEAVDIKLSDISLESGTLLVADGKGSKSRMLYPPPQFFVAIKAWLVEREKIAPTHDYLWTQGSNRRISDEWLRKHLEEIKAIAGLKGRENVKPHSLRHWFATSLHRNGATVKQVQAALGHSDIKTTAVYLHIDEEDCKAMAQLAAFDLPSPRGTASTTAAKQKPDPVVKPIQQPTRKPSATEYFLKRKGAARTRIAA